VGVSRRTINARNMSTGPATLTRRQRREADLIARVKRRAWREARARESLRVLAVLLLVFLPAYLVLELTPWGQLPVPWWVIVLLGGVMFALGIRVLAQQLAAARWPSTTCRIECSDVENYARSWHPIVSYVYEVGGKEYTSDLVRIVDGYSSFAGARAQAERYTPGSIRRCYFNPANPRKAVLERHVRLDVPIKIMIFGFGVSVLAYLVS